MRPLSTPSGAVRHRMQAADLGTGAHTPAVRPRVALARSATVAKSVPDTQSAHPSRHPCSTSFKVTKKWGESSVRRVHSVAKGRPHRFQ